MATLSDDVQALVTAVQDNTQATADAGSRVSIDLAALKAQVAAGQPVDPALIASLETQTATIQANTKAILDIDPANPTAPAPTEAPPSA